MPLQNKLIHIYTCMGAVKSGLYETNKHIDSSITFFAINAFLISEKFLHNNRPYLKTDATCAWYAFITLRIAIFCLNRLNTYTNKFILIQTHSTCAFHLNLSSVKILKTFIWYTPGIFVFHVKFPIYFDYDRDHKVRN